MKIKNSSVLGTNIFHDNNYLLKFVLEQGKLKEILVKPKFIHVGYLPRFQHNYILFYTDSDKARDFIPMEQKIIGTWKIKYKNLNK